MNIFESNNSFWNTLELDICYKLPNYIKNILTFCNFGNVLSIQRIDDDDIRTIQEMIKCQFKEWLDEKLERIDFLDYFGPVYDTKPEQFILSGGDKRMIQQISEFVRTTVEKRGYTHFNGEDRRHVKNTTQSKAIGSNAGEAAMQEKLFNAVSDLLQPYGENVVSQFKIDMVEVTIDGTVIKGRVRCILCDIGFGSQTIKRKRRQELYSLYWNGYSWCLSNFANHHLCNLHPIQEKADIDLEINAVGAQKFKLECSQSLRNNDVENMNNDEDSNDEDLDSSSYNESKEEPSLIELKIEPCTIDPQNKFDPNFNILRSALQFHNIQMINKFGNRAEGAECKVELSNGEISLVRVCPIPTDGDCLFGSSVHQHFLLEVGSEEYVQQVIELRKEVVKHIKENLTRFERNILNRIHENRPDNNTKKMKIDNVEEVCSGFLDNNLSKRYYWGGTETITAISELLKTNVIIFDEGGSVRFGNSFERSYKNIITLAYRLKKNNTEENPPVIRNHYDSLIKLNDDILHKSAAILTATFTKSNSLKNVPDTICIE